MIAKLDFTASVQEMRCALHAAARDDYVVHRCLEHAHRSGLSGDDTHTLLAYQLCVAKDEMEARLLRQIQMSVSQPVIIIKQPDKAT